MKNLVLVISSSNGRQAWLADVLQTLNQDGRSINVLAKSKRLVRRLHRERIRAKKLTLPVLPPLLFCIALPILWIFFGLVQFFRVMSKRPEAIVLCNWPEKIILSPFSSVFGTKLIWLEDPSQNLFPTLFFIPSLYKRFAKKVDSVFTLFPSVIKPVARQHNLFKTLAEAGDRSRFVVGSVLFGLPKDQAERLLSALAIAQSVCPLIELVIIGSGKNRQQIQWLSRRMGLERKVWLAGPTDDFQRWLTHLDTYIIASAEPSLDDAAWALTAMSAGLPILAPQREWLAEVITTKAGALIDIMDPEIIARQLISLQQNETMRETLGKEAQKTAEQFSFERLAHSVAKVLS